MTRRRTITTRLATPDDARAIADLHVASWRAGYRGVIDDEVLDSPRLITARRDGWQRLLAGDRHVADPDQELFVGELDGDVVGFGLVGAADHAPDAGGDSRFDGGEIHAFYAHPDAWGSGVADAMMADCLEHLRRRFDHALLWTFRDTLRSRRFYERHGWSCGTGDEIVHGAWSGPAMPGAPVLREPVPEIQYRRTLP